MKADIHPDGTLRIYPQSLTEQVALRRWLEESREKSDDKDVLKLKAESLVLLAVDANQRAPS